jgi:hypothetical protein
MKRRAEQREDSGVEWSGMEWSGVEWSGTEWNGVEWSGVVCKQHVLSREREQKVSFFTQTTHSIQPHFYVCVLFLIFVVVREENKHREEKRRKPFFCVEVSCVQQFVENNQLHFLLVLH